MNKKDFFWDIGQKSKCSQRIVRLVIEAMVDVAKENLIKGEDIRFENFITIKPVDIEGAVKHSGFKETYYMPAHKKLRLVVSRSFREQLGGVLTPDSKSNKKDVAAED